MRRFGYRCGGKCGRKGFKREYHHGNVIPGGRCNVIKPLISVKRLTEKRNRVIFGPEEEDNYMESKDSGKKVSLT